MDEHLWILHILYKIAHVVRMAKEYIALENDSVNHSTYIESQKKINRKARLVVRNIPYKIKDVQLKQYFEKFGEVLEICTLKRPDGKIVGCSFIQFRNIEDAKKAVENCHKKKLMGRILHVDFAISKQDHAKVIADKKEEITEIKRKVDIIENKQQANKKRKITNDAEDGLTIFIKNLNFDITNEELAESMSQFGSYHYVLVNREPVSGHSKGTGFVRFKKKDSAQLCLQNSGKLVLKDFALEMFPALNRSEAKKLQVNQVEKQPKDKRNLYL